MCSKCDICQLSLHFFTFLLFILCSFDTETELYEAKERAAKRQELENEVLHVRDLLSLLLHIKYLLFPYIHEKVSLSSTAG